MQGRSKTLNEFILIVSNNERLEGGNQSEYKLDHEDMTSVGITRLVISNAEAQRPVDYAAQDQYD